MKSNTQPTDEQMRTVEIPERTAERISTRLSGTAFDSVDAYVAFALDQLLRELDRKSTGSDRPTSPKTDSDDEDATERVVQERLESLGYL
jgi:Arc/MetJ-type ribon-helix-helix transcriptional regulator